MLSEGLYCVYKVNKATQEREENDMNRPETLTYTTIGEARAQYRKNQKLLNRVVLFTNTGVYAEMNSTTGESLLNTLLVNVIIEQEYLREREAKNWGWKPERVDFSTMEDRIPQFRV